MLDLNCIKTNKYLREHFHYLPYMIDFLKTLLSYYLDLPHNLYSKVLLRYTLGQKRCIHFPVLIL